MDIRRVLKATLLAAAACVGFCGVAWAAPGNIVGFDFTRDSGSSKEDPLDVVVGASGKIYVLNRVDTFDYLLQRFNANGTVDTSFSGDGKIEFEAASALSDAEGFFALAVDEANQRALIGGTQTTNIFSGDPGFVVKRLRFNGSFDNTFGSGGRALVGTPNAGVVFRMSLDASGRILLAGVDGGVDIASEKIESAKPFIARLTAGGDVDASFTQTTIEWGGDNDGPSGIFVQSGGTILVSGAASLNAALEFGEESTLARLLPNGGIDVGFGSGGVFVRDFEPGTCEDNNKVGCEGAGLYRPLAGGKFLMLVYIDRTGSAGTADTIQITRFNANGSLDTGFGTGGSQRSESFDFIQGTIPALLPDDTIVGAKDVGAAGGKDLRLYRVEGYSGIVGGGAPNKVPKAVADSARVNEDTRNNTLRVLSNDTDADGDTLTITSFTRPDKGGTVKRAANNKSLLYTPKANFAGTETFLYTVSDGKGGTASAKVTVSVRNANNDAPDAKNDSLTIPKGFQYRTLNVLANDRDPDPNTTLRITRRVGAQPANGTVRITSDGKLQYRPDQGFVGTDTFGYEISDGTLTDTATVIVRVR